MPKKNSQPAPVSAFARLAVAQAYAGANRKGNTMPATTRSQHRAGYTASPQAQAGSSRSGQARVGTPRTPLSAAQDDDEDSDSDSDSGSGSDSDEDDSDDSSEDSADSDESDDEDEDETIVSNIFAIGEPNGLVRTEHTQGHPTSTEYAALVRVVADFAAENSDFLRALKARVNVPSDQWSKLMARRLRTRWETTMLRFDRNPSDPTNRYDVINTAERLKNLTGAIKRMTRATYWGAMRLDTRMEFFSLLLDIIRDVVGRNSDHYRGRGSPYAMQSSTDVNLYQRLIGQSQDAFAVKVLRIMVKRGLGVPLTRQIAYIDEIINELKRRSNVRPGSSVSGRSSASSGSSGAATKFGEALLALRERMSPQQQ